MQIKKFEAQDLKEALKKIKKEFGPEAVILSVKKIETNKSLFGFTKEYGVEVSAAIDTIPLTGPTQYPNRTAGNYSAYYNRSITQSNQEKPGILAGFMSGAKRSGKIKSASVERPFTKSRGSKELYLAYCQLIDQDVEKSIALDLIKAVSQMTSSNNYLFKNGFKACLANVLEGIGITSARVKILKQNPKIVALIGTTGVGKTTTIAKLAGVAMNRERSQRVALISLDDNRIGAIEQLKIYSKISGIPLLTAVNKAGLKESLEKLENYDLVLIDTPGMSQKNQEQLSDLKNIFIKNRDIEFHLVMNATTNNKTLNELYDNFKTFDPKRMIFTKLDEGVTFGPILNQLYRARIPVSYFTHGQQIPEDIEAASIEKLVDMITVKNSNHEHLKGSPEELVDILTRFEGMLEENRSKTSYFNVANSAQFIEVPQNTSMNHYGRYHR